MYLYPFTKGYPNLQFQEESYHPPIREIYGGWSNVSNYRPTTRKRPIARSNSMRISMDFEQSIPAVQYEKSKGSLSSTQTDMERKSGNIYG